MSVMKGYFAQPFAATGNEVTQRDDVAHVGLTEADMVKLIECREIRVLLNVSYSVQMVHRLADRASSDAPSMHSFVRSACRDAFFLHVRRIAGFFWTRPKTDDNARLLHPTWNPPPELAERLSRHWKRAAPFVSPLRRIRTRVDLDDTEPVDLSSSALWEIVADCDATVRAFLDACEAAEIELLPEVRGILDPAYA